jgi:hypothetical protein
LRKLDEGGGSRNAIEGQNQKGEGLKKSQKVEEGKKARLG